MCSLGSQWKRSAGLLGRISSSCSVEMVWMHCCSCFKHGFTLFTWRAEGHPAPEGLSATMACQARGQEAPMVVAGATSLPLPPRSCCSAYHLQEAHPLMGQPALRVQGWAREVVCGIEAWPPPSLGPNTKP